MLNTWRFLLQADSEQAECKPEWMLHYNNAIISLSHYRLLNTAAVTRGSATKMNQQ